MHHPNIIIQLFAHNNIISVEACLILSLTYKLHTEMIHINLTPNTEEGWADKVLKTNLWPINLDTWAALKASENEIFFVEDDVEPNTEGQLNDIPTKLELRTNDLCTHLINKSLLKEFILIFFRRGIRVLNSQNRRNFDIFVNLFWPPFTFGGVAGGTSIRTFTLGSHRFWPLLCSVGSHILLFYFLKARRAVMGPTKCGPIWGG